MANALLLREPYYDEIDTSDFVTKDYLKECLQSYISPGTTVAKTLTFTIPTSKFTISVPAFDKSITLTHTIILYEFTNASQVKVTSYSNNHSSTALNGTITSGDNTILSENFGIDKISWFSNWTPTTTGSSYPYTNGNATMNPAMTFQWSRLNKSTSDSVGGISTTTKVPVYVSSANMRFNYTTCQLLMILTLQIRSWTGYNSKTEIETATPKDYPGGTLIPDWAASINQTLNLEITG